MIFQTTIMWIVFTFFLILSLGVFANVKDKYDDRMISKKVKNDATIYIIISVTLLFLFCLAIQIKVTQINKLINENNQQINTTKSY